MDKIYRINLGSQSSKTEEPGAYANKGGRGLTSLLVAREVPPDCHALGERNVLVMAPGLLTGTSCANSGRLSMGAKSPLTGGIKESNVGGVAGTKLARLGIKALVIEGRAPAGKTSYLLINGEGVSFHDAAVYAGLGNYDTAEQLRAKHGEKVGVISVGTCGEFRMSASSIAVTDLDGHPSRHAGRGGLGAVMGSKGLKAIVIDDAGAEAITYADKEAFKKAAAVFRDAITAHPVTKSGGGLSTFGTNVLVNIINAAGGLPTRNFSAGQFEGAARISGEAMNQIITERGGKVGKSGCTSCIIQCSNVYLDRDGKYLTSGLEYETVWANGANLGIDDLDAIATIDRLCDDYGLDTVEIGGAIGVAMAGGLLEFGDAEGAIDLVHQAGKGTPLGRIIGNGAAVTGQAFGVEQVPVVKRQSLPAYDPRAVKGMGVSYATSPMGGDHTSGYTVASNIMRIGGYVDPLQAEGQAELSKRMQIATANLDAAGLCIFVSFAILDNPDALAAIPAMINARHGTSLTGDQLFEQGREVLRAEVAFNRAAGIDPSQDRLPAFFREKPLAPHNTVFDVPQEELDRVVDF